MADQALTAGRLGEYQDHFDKAQELVARALALANGTEPSSSPSPAGSSPSAKPSASGG